VLIDSASAPDSTKSIGSRLWRSRFSACCSQPGNLPRFRSDDADAHRKDCFELFRSVETALQHPAVCVRSSLADACRGIGADEARPWQRHMAGLPAVQLDRLQSVLNAAVRLIYWHGKFDHVSPLLKKLHLAASARAYHLPVGSSCLPMSAHGAALPHRPAPGQQRWLPAASTLVVVGLALCSSHWTHDHWWPCVQFNCSSCVEQFPNGSAVFWVTGHFLIPPEKWTVRTFLQLTRYLSNNFADAWLTYTFPAAFCCGCNLEVYWL